ncbi:MAG: thiamine-phosphate kinase [Steroidobacteraceae bacterium]
MEADLISRYFVGLGAARDDVTLGIGDDAAIVRAPTDQELVLTTDALIEGVHFLPGADAHSLGHRSLAVNLSDLAAMGAEPAWALLSLNLPKIEAAWLERFAAGFGALARSHGVALIGGNLSRGPLSISVQITGFAPPGAALRRAGAQPGDLIYVSGTPGDAAAGLASLLAGRQGPAELLRRFAYPEPRVMLGLVLRGLASACVDLSDGLYADLAHLAAASGCSAQVEVERLPVSAALQQRDGAAAWRRVLSGGEDYELCFTVPPARQAELEHRLAGGSVACRAIGVMAGGAGLQILHSGSVIPFTHAGFDHFAPGG